MPQYCSAVVIRQVLNAHLIVYLFNDSGNDKTL